ncbi:hypothetical protein DFH07DRAFT_768305 [Mycena maculata]|uniref:Uncharacterized protein n=1 Tax=Mycena maculata TaxID=230809 RepID=A0AAD7NQC7_9AGAR|nr:hypothetical protein DFH07DRAFT_768305 [Mycena maculata]
MFLYVQAYIRELERLRTDHGKIRSFDRHQIQPKLDTSLPHCSLDACSRYEHLNLTGDYPHSDSDDSESNKNAGSTSRKLKRKSSSVQLVSSPITRSRSETSSSARRRRTNTPNEKDETEENFVPEKDDVDEDEDEDELALTPPPKRRKSQVESDDEEVPEVDVTYNISIFKGAELSKPIKKRQSACNGFIKIANTSSFHAFQKQLFLKVSKLLRTDVRMDDDGVNITFTVPRHVPAPLQLDDLTNYEHVVASGLKCKASPSGENSQSSEEEDTSKKNKSEGKKVKSKIPTENDISPINASVNQKILELRTRYACHANDGSDYCWVSGEAKEHVALGNPHFQMWGAGWVRHYSAVIWMYTNKNYLN